MRKSTGPPGESRHRYQVRISGATTMEPAQVLGYEQLPDKSLACREWGLVLSVKKFRRVSHVGKYVRIGHSLRVKKLTRYRPLVQGNLCEAWGPRLGFESLKVGSI